MSGIVCSGTERDLDDVDGQQGDSKEVEVV